MEPPIYQRKWEALSRASQRINEYYQGKIDQQDSSNGPKDFVYAYFHATYSLKEALKTIDNFGGHNGVVETFIINEPIAALGIDISNIEKHISISNSKSGKVIGKINSCVSLNLPGKNRTKLTIEIDGVKKDCLDLVNKNLNAWKKFMFNNNINI